MKIEVQGDFAGQVIGGDQINVVPVHIVMGAGLTADEVAVLVDYRAAKAREVKRKRGMYEGPASTVLKTG